MSAPGEVGLSDKGPGPCARCGGWCQPVGPGTALSPEELDEIERVWAAATPGPWLVTRWEDRTSQISGIATDDLTPIIAASEELAVTEENAQAIARAPMHVAMLLAEVRRLRPLAGTKVDLVVSVVDRMSAPLQKMEADIITALTGFAAPAADDSYQRFLDETARTCRCCSTCPGGVPCPGCCAGGLCDGCNCSEPDERHGWSEDDDRDPDADDDGEGAAP